MGNNPRRRDVTSSKKDCWDVRAPDSSCASSCHGTQQEAIDAGRRILKNHGGGELRIKGARWTRARAGHRPAWQRPAEEQGLSACDFAGLCVSGASRFSSMSWPERLFRLDGAFPRELTPRRLLRLRKLVLLGLVAALPAPFFAYHVERVQPLADHFSSAILETLVNEDDATPSRTSDAQS